MRLARVGSVGSEIPVVVTDSGELLDLRGLTTDITPEFIGSGGIERCREAVATGSLPPLAGGELKSDSVRYGPPVSRPPKLVCIGLNYADHAEEAGMAAPTEPVVFAKMTNTVIGPGDEVLIPVGSEKTDYEVELAVIIGRPGRYLESEDAAKEIIAGYAVSNDVSEREFQIERGGQWVKGKSCETFNPLGPWLVTADSIADVNSLRLQLSVNGELRQNGTTANMIFGVYHLVWYLSQFMVLEPGDVISTGTPAGVVLGSATADYLRPGDVMELSIEGLGSQRQVLGQADRE